MHPAAGTGDRAGWKRKRTVSWSKGKMKENRDKTCNSELQVFLGPAREAIRLRAMCPGCPGFPSFFLYSSLQSCPVSSQPCLRFQRRPHYPHPASITRRMRRIPSFIPSIPFMKLEDPATKISACFFDISPASS